MMAERPEYRSQARLRELQERALGRRVDQAITGTATPTGGVVGYKGVVKTATIQVQTVFAEELKTCPTDVLEKMLDELRAELGKRGAKDV